MVEKVKNLNWAFYSEVSLVFANILAIFCVAMLALNTKNLTNTTIIVYYLILGLMALVLLKLNHAAGNE
jgi:undecaprenyl pyrophosphate phosphatase UppP